MEKIHLALLEFYSKNGYAFNKSTYTFKKNQNEVSWTIRSKYPQSNLFRPLLVIRNQEIIQFLNSVEGINVNMTSKHGQSIKLAHDFEVYEFDKSPFVYSGNYGIESSIYSYEVEESTDLTPIVEDHISFMEKVGFKYFEALITVKGINEYFNDRLLELSDEVFEDATKKEETGDSFQKEEVLSAIVSAHVEKDERLNEIIERYKKLYSDNNWYLQDIEKLVEFLNKNQ